MATAATALAATASSDRAARDAAEYLAGAEHSRPRPNDARLSHARRAPVHCHAAISTRADHNTRQAAYLVEGPAQWAAAVGGQANDAALGQVGGAGPHAQHIVALAGGRHIHARHKTRKLLLSRRVARNKTAAT
jgi:hypothetical protein